MGRLPQFFANRQITEREPYNIAGELIMSASQTAIQFPANTFDHNIDKPFEIHRVIPRVTAMNADGLVILVGSAATYFPLDQDMLQSLVRLRIENAGRNVLLQKSSTLMRSYTKGESERTWEWADPYYLIRGEGLTVSVDTQAFPALFATFTAPITRLRVELDFQGFNIVVAPPSENR